jgi:hypothetical protein
MADDHRPGIRWRRGSTSFPDRPAKASASSSARASTAASGFLRRRYLRLGSLGRVSGPDRRSPAGRRLGPPVGAGVGPRDHRDADLRERGDAMLRYRTVFLGSLREEAGVLGPRSHQIGCTAGLLLVFSCHWLFDAIPSATVLLHSFPAVTRVTGCFGPHPTSSTLGNAEAGTGRRTALGHG